MFSALLGHIPRDKQASVVEAMELLTDLFSPENEVFQKMHAECCSDESVSCCGTDSEGCGS